MPTWVRRRPYWRYARRQPIIRTPSVSTGTFDTTEFTALPSGATGIFFFDPTFNPVAELTRPIIPIAWKTSRYQNKVGSWSARVAVDDQVGEGVALHTTLKRGWHVCLVQEGNFPENDNTKEYLLFMGVILTRELISDSVTATLELTGSFRTQHLVERQTFSELSYDTSITAIADDLVSGADIIGAPGGIVTPAQPDRTATVTFSDTTRYNALVKLAELARYSLRETWNNDQPELVPIDGPPDSGVTLMKVEAYDPSQDDSAEAGIGLISGTPTIRYDGTGVLNRIIPIGSDVEDNDLTLEYSDAISPYTIQAAVDSNGHPRYYIEDVSSIAEYGVIEYRMVRTDIRNPSDNAGTRRLSANVLYASAVNEMVKHRSEKAFITIPVANGANLWMLPGDMCRLDYVGNVQTESGNLVWANIDRKRFMVAERHDVGDPSGVRQVEFVLAAPELEFPVPELPGAIILPPLETPFGGLGGLTPLLPFPRGLGNISDPCCVDPNIEINDAPAVPASPAPDADLSGLHQLMAHIGQEANTPNEGFIGVGSSATLQENDLVVFAAVATWTELPSNGDPATYRVPEPIYDWAVLRNEGGGVYVDVTDTEINSPVMIDEAEIGDVWVGLFYCRALMDQPADGFTRLFLPTIGPESLERAVVRLVSVYRGAELADPIKSATIVTGAEALTPSISVTPGNAVWTGTFAFTYRLHLYMDSEEVLLNQGNSSNRRFKMLQWAVVGGTRGQNAGVADENGFSTYQILGHGGTFDDTEGATTEWEFEGINVDGVGPTRQDGIAFAIEIGAA